MLSSTDLVESAPTSTADGGQGSAKINRRKLSHVARACQSCRRRKIKCSGESPRCANCTSANCSCDYGTGIDNRKHVSKDFVNALTKRNEDLTVSVSTAEQEVARLRAALTEANHRLKYKLGNDNDDHVGTGSKKRRTRDSRMGLEDDDEDHDVAEFAVDGDGDDGSGVAIMMDSLKLIDNSGEVRSFGPTSSFALFPDCKANEMPDPRAPLLGDSTPSREIYEYFRQGPQPPTDTWRMYLPAELPLTFELHESLLDHFEAFFAPWCAVVNMPLFRADLSTLSSRSPHLARTAHYSPLLHNSIIGLSIRFSSILRPEVLPLIASHAKKFVLEELDSPLLSTVRGLMTLASVHSGLLRIDLAWLYFGMALRTGETLGLNVDCSHLVSRGLLTAAQKSHRDLTFWALFTQDKLWSLVLGRSPSFVNHNVPLPTPDPETDKIPFILPTEVVRSDFIIPRPGMISSTLVALSAVLTISIDIMTELYSLRADQRSEHRRIVVSKLRLQLETWFDALPEGLRVGSRVSQCPKPHILLLNMVYWFCSILVHRVHYFKLNETSDVNDLAVRKCDQAAKKVVFLLELYNRGVGLQYGPFTNTHVAFAAASIFLMGAVRSTKAPQRREESLKGLASCISALRTMAHPWAARTAQSLEELREEWLPTNFAEAPSPAPITPIRPPSGYSPPEISNGLDMDLLHMHPLLAPWEMDESVGLPYDGSELFSGVVESFTPAQRDWSAVPSQFDFFFDNAPEEPSGVV